MFSKLKRLEYRYFTPNNFHNLALELDCLEACVYYAINIESSFQHINDFEFFVNDINVIISEKNNAIEDIFFPPLSLYTYPTNKYISLDFNEFCPLTFDINTDKPCILFTDSASLYFDKTHGNSIKKFEASKDNIYDLRPFLLIGQDKCNYFCTYSPSFLSKNIETHEENDTVIVVSKIKLQEALRKFYFLAYVDYKILDHFPKEILLENTIMGIINNYHQEKYNCNYIGRQGLLKLKDYLHNMSSENINQITSSKWNMPAIELYQWKSRELCSKRRLLLNGINQNTKLFNSIALEKLSLILTKLVKFWLSLTSLLIQFQRTLFSIKHVQILELYDQILLLENALIDELISAKN